MASTRFLFLTNSIMLATGYDKRMISGRKTDHGSKPKNGLHPQCHPVTSIGHLAQVVEIIPKKTTRTKNTRDAIILNLLGVKNLCMYL